MDLELTRIDYGNIGTTPRNCLQLLPNDYKKQQRVVVADIEGNLQTFGIKKTEAQVIFQVYAGRKVSCLCLGGVMGSSLDKVFIATDNIVKAYTRKGKMFLTFDTNLTESIKCMFVVGADLLVCGNHVYNHYRDCKDMGTYLCGDTIVDVIALCPNNTNRILTILACSGRVLRVLEHSRVRQTIELESVPTTLHVRSNASGDRMLCGFADGKVIAFNFGGFIAEVKQHVLITSEHGSSAITCIDTYDLSGDGNEDLLIGRRDGTIQAFTLPTEEDVDLEPRELYRESFAESISAIQGGCVYANGANEIVVATYAGSVFGLTTQIVSINLSDKELFKELLVKNLAMTNSKDISNTDETTTINLVKPQERYTLSTTIVSSPTATMSSTLDINDALTLDSKTATYNLSIEMTVSILEILFQSEASIQLLDIENCNAIITENDIDPSTGYQLSTRATIKNESSQFDIQFQTVEGQYGNLEAYIMPNIHPNCVQLKAYLIRPLSLHIRIHTFDSSRPLNELSLKGSFTWAEMHNWIEQLLPEVPEHLTSGTSIELYYKNTLIGTILQCQYGKGSAEFKSDNLSTISILKDFLTKEATKKRIKLEILSKISEPSIPHVLRLIEPSITKILKIQEEHKFLQALLQVDIRDEDDLNCLLPKYRSILERRNEIEKNFTRTPLILSRYFGLITDFYIDRFKFKGIFVKDKIPELVKLLEKYDLDAILEYFSAYTVDEINTKVV